MNQDLHDLYVATFVGEDSASEALKRVQAAANPKGFKIEEAATIQVQPDKKLKIHETGDSGGGRGAAIGGAVGAAIGLLGGPLALLTATAGAAIGGMMASLSDAGFPDEQLELIGRSLAPGMSALVVLIKGVGPVEIESDLRQAGAATIKSAKIDRNLFDPRIQAGYSGTGSGSEDAFQKAAGAAAINLMDDIVRDEHKPATE